MRRKRRTRLGNRQEEAVQRLMYMLKQDNTTIEALLKGNRKKAFGRLLNNIKFSQHNESIIEAIVDEEATKAVGTALNRTLVEYNLPANHGFK